jgi:hypothetical protein
MVIAAASPHCRKTSQEERAVKADKRCMTFNVAHENYVAACLSMPLSFDHLPGGECVSYRDRDLLRSGPEIFRQGKLTKGPIEGGGAFT